MVGRVADDEWYGKFSTREELILELEIKDREREDKNKEYGKAFALSYTVLFNAYGTGPPLGGRR